MKAKMIEIINKSMAGTIRRQVDSHSPSSTTLLELTKLSAFDGVTQSQS